LTEHIDISGLRLPQRARWNTEIHEPAVWSGTYITVCHPCLQVTLSLKQNGNGWQQTTSEGLGPDQLRSWHVAGFRSIFNYAWNYVQGRMILVTCCCASEFTGSEAGRITRYLCFIFYICDLVS